MIKKKWFLYCTEFFAGMSVMAVELGASRLLAPYFSSSQIIWTIIIGTIMIAMALGNVIGGRLADKKPDPNRLYFCLLISALWIALIPFLGKYIIGAISVVLALFVSQNFLVWAAFTCCIVIFVFPLLLLGMVTPTLAKFTMHNLDDNAKIVGELNALNTIGCILGTFLPTFVIIPKVGTIATFIIFATILFTLAAIYFIALRKKMVTCIVNGVIIAGLLLASPMIKFSVNQKGIIYEGESMYNYLKVYEDDYNIYFSTNVIFGVQSIKSKTNDTTNYYYDFLICSLYMAKFDLKQVDRDLDILILGLGTGTFATAVHQLFPNANIEAVEIDGKIVDLAREYFDLPDAINVSVFDGRAYMETAGEYDLILVDAYQDITIPFQMSSVEFFQLIEDHLKEDGMMAVNLNMYSDNLVNINIYLEDTICSVFDHCYRYRLMGSTNCILFVTNDYSNFEDFEENYKLFAPNKYKNHCLLVLEGLEKVEGGNRILTDDKAPVELLGMSVLDEIINEQLEYYRNLIKGKTIKEIIAIFK